MGILKAQARGGHQGCPSNCVESKRGGLRQLQQLGGGDRGQQRHHATSGRFNLNQHQRGPGPSHTFPTMAPSRGPQPLPRTLHQALKAHKGTVNVATYAKGTAKYVLSGGQDRTIRLWNPSAGTEIKAYSGHGYEVLSITM